MFLAELAYNTVAKEIQELENKKVRRQTALETSTKELEDDHMDLIKFIQEDTKHGEERAEEEKKQQKLKAEKEDRLKGIETSIAAIKSDIDKNKDALGQLVGA